MKPVSPLKRTLYMRLVFSIILGLLTTKLLFIQVFQGPRYSRMALPQQMLTIPIEQLIGNITDRNCIPFTKIDTEYELIVIPGYIEHESISYETINKLTQLDKESLPLDSYYILQVRNKDPELLSEIEAGMHKGLLIRKSNIRYSEASLARHVVGYIRKSDSQPLSGIEKVYGEYLHPNKCRLLYALTDAKGSILPNYDYIISEPSSAFYDVQLTLDYDIQFALEKILDKQIDHYIGGIVVEANSGDILALASRPHFNQNNPSVSDNNEISELAIPLNQYPAGSIFKLVVAAAALESGRYNEYSMFHCEGGIQVGEHFVRCHQDTDGLGDITFKEAFVYSCNDTFIKIAMDLGGEKIVNMAKQLGFGASIDIELVNSSGNLGNKDTYTGPGIANLALGQGEVMVTPLQVAKALLIILNGGEERSLSLVKGLVAPNGDIKQMGKTVFYDKVLSSITTQTLKNCMEDVVEYGTGIQAKDIEIGGTAGKTGTPQILSSSEYGWFAGYFPIENPRYIIVIMSTEGGGAAKTAAPVFHDIAKAIWQLDKEYNLTDTK